MAFNINPGKQQFSATVAQTVFTFNFAIFANTDLKVYKTLAGAVADDTADLLTLSTHYTVSINGTLGGAVTLLSGASLNDIITIVRVLPVTRSTDYVTNGDLYADTLDSDQDYQTYLVQDGYVQLNRAIILPESSGNINMNIPSPTADAYLRWNATADALENDDTIPQKLVDAQTAATTATTQAGIATTQAGLATTSATDAQLRAWEAEADRMTADSYATEAEDVLVKSYTSDGDGTFTATNTAEYSALHWSAKSALSALGSAINISYDNTSSSMVATDVQTAIDEIDTRSDTHIPLSGVTAYNLLSGNISLSNTVVTAGMATTLYTGNGTTLSVVTGVDMATQWGNSASETFGGMMWGKSRGLGGNNVIADTVQGIQKEIYPNLTNAQAPNTTGLTSFNADGFSIGASSSFNQATTYASWNFQTTHRITGTTNHGKAYTCHYNPFTGFTMIKYEGSGLAGHEIPHHLGRKLGFVTTKNLSAVAGWNAQYRELFALQLELTNAEVTSANGINSLNDNSCVLGTSTLLNTSTNQYIMYGWTNSYFDESNALIGNYEIGVYQGTGAAGNKVTTRGKPAWVMRKAVSATGNWVINDNTRSTLTMDLWANLSNAEADGSNDIIFNSDSFTLNGISSDSNASGVQYLYMVVYDNDAGSGKSKYPRATDISAITINATLPLAKGLDLSGSKVSVVAKNETITGLTLTEGDNYVYYYE